MGKHEINTKKTRLKAKRRRGLWEETVNKQAIQTCEKTGKTRKLRASNVGKFKVAEIRKIV